MWLRRRSAAADAAEVIPGLRIGPCPDAAQISRLVSAGVTCVVDVRAESPGSSAWPDDVVRLQVSLIDHATPSVDELRHAASMVVQAIREGHDVYLHCLAGQERAPTVACATLLLQGWSLGDAYKRVVASRPSAAPTEGQMDALRRLAESLNHGDNRA